MFTLVTSNQEKVHFARLECEKVGVSFNVASLSLVEIQADKPRDIILHKATQAFASLKKPIVVSDHWWSFPALGGFPGPYMHFVNDTLKASDLIQLLQGKTDRRAIFTETICYKDDVSEKVFSQSKEGSVLASPQGGGVPCQQIISLSDDGQSIATHINQGTDPLGGTERKVWRELAAWFKKRATPAVS